LTILGQDRVPSKSYIIRENEQLNYDLENNKDYNFEQLSVNCAPDTREVHQLIHGLETAETWIKPQEEKRQNG
jgi:hypothetical protein